MDSIVIGATDFARGLSDYLNQVQYRGQVLDIERGKRVIARVIPPEATEGFPIEQLGEFFTKGAVLSAAERRSFAKDLQGLRSERVGARDSDRHKSPWAC